MFGSRSSSIASSYRVNPLGLTAYHTRMPAPICVASSFLFRGRYAKHVPAAVRLAVMLLGLRPSTLAAQTERESGWVLAPIPQARQFADCLTAASGGRPCRLTSPPARADVRNRLVGEGAAAWAAADTVHILYRPAVGAVRSVEVGGGIQLPMTRLPGGDIWALSIHFRDASRATVSIEFWVTTTTGFLRDTLSLREWRGAAAAPRALRARQLRGQLRTDSLWSGDLRWRRITYYQPAAAPARSPVIYLGDGQAVSELAPILDTLITVGQLPPVTLVGVWSAMDRGSSGTPADDSRGVEYVPGVEFAPGVDSAAIVRRRQAHREFFVEHVRLWAERTLDVARTRELRAAWGVSNSALFALTLGRDYPEVYGAVIAHSHGQSSLLSHPVGGWDRLPAHFVTVGALEQDRLHRVLMSLSDSLQAHRVPVTLRVLPSGHDAMTWRESLPAAVSWWLRQ